MNRGEAPCAPQVRPGKLRYLLVGNTSGWSDIVPPQALLHISATHLTLARLSRGGGLSRRRVIERAATDESWAERMAALEAPLQRLVEELRCAGARTMVVSDSPGATVEMQSTPVGGRAARHAAFLALHDATSLHPSDPVVVSEVGKDGAGAPRRTHTLAVSDSAACAEASLDLARRVGLKPMAIAPVAAVTLAESATTALANRTREPLATLRIEDRYSTLAVSSHRRLHLLRLIDLGLDRLQEALTRPVLRDGQELALTEHEARAMLERFGVPDVDDIVDTDRGFRGGDVLPLLQPVLQRLVVEVKQSLRFGLNDEDRSRLRLRLEGAGAATHGLGEIIAQETGIALDKGDSMTDAEPLQALRHAAIVRRFNVMPPRLVQSKMMRRAQVGMVVGSALAVSLLSLEAAWNIWMTRSLDARLAALTPVTEQIDANIERHAAAQRELALLRKAATSIFTDAPPRAHWAAWLAELSRAAPVAIRLHSVSGAIDNGATIARIDGVASGNGAEESRDAITHMLDALRDCPLVESVTLDGVRRADGGDDAAHAFSATIALRTTPVAPPAAPAQMAEVTDD